MYATTAELAANLARPVRERLFASLTLPLPPAARTLDARARLERLVADTIVPQVLASARSRAPEEDGDLKRSLTADVVVTRDELTIAVKSPLVHAGVQEFGSRKRNIPARHFASGALQASAGRTAQAIAAVVAAIEAERLAASDIAPPVAPDIEFAAAPEPEPELVPERPAPGVAPPLEVAVPRAVRVAGLTRRAQQLAAPPAFDPLGALPAAADDAAAVVFAPAIDAAGVAHAGSALATLPELATLSIGRATISDLAAVAIAGAVAVSALVRADDEVSLDLEGATRVPAPLVGDPLHLTVPRTIAPTPEVVRP